MSKARSAKLPLVRLVLEPRLQLRALGMNPEHVADLRGAARAKRLPKVKVRLVGPRHYVTDGFHTVEAHRLEGNHLIPCQVRTGTWEDAVHDACGANRDHHALKRTRADKRNAALRMLEFFSDWENARIARHVGVSHTYINRLRNELADESKETIGNVSLHQTGDDCEVMEVEEPENARKKKSRNQSGTFKLCARCARIRTPSCEKCRKKAQKGLTPVVPGEAKRPISAYSQTSVDEAIQTLAAHLDVLGRDRGALYDDGAVRPGFSPYQELLRILNELPSRFRDVAAKLSRYQQRDVV